MAILSTIRPESIKNPNIASPYDSWESVYLNNDVFQLPWYSESIHPSLKAAVDHLPIKSGKALDIGCGLGQTSRYLSEIGFDVTAIDASKAAIKLAKEHTKPELSVIYKYSNSINFKSQYKFNLIVDFLHFHDVQETDLLRYISNLIQLCSKKSYIIISSLSDIDSTCPTNKYRRSHFADCYVYYYSEKFIESLFKFYAKLICSDKIKVGKNDEAYIANLLIFEKY